MPPFCGLTRSLNKSAQTPLITAATAFIEILQEVDQYPALYLNRRVLQNAVFRYEHRWIPLLASQPPSQRLYLVPPLDVQWVWFCHMLCPVKYITDSAAMWRTVRPDDYDVIIDHKLFLGAERQDGRRKAALVWEEMFPDESFDNLRSLKEAPIHESMQIRESKLKKKKPTLESKITYDIVSAAERQMTFHYQVAVMPQYKDKLFLRHSVKRYNAMFLKLQKRFPDEIWVPTYDIDVIWHSHMMHPRWYKESTEKLVGSVLPHDDTLNERTAGSELDVRWNATVQKWTRLFREPVVRHGGMWRGNVERQERMERPRIKKLIQIVENRALSTIEKLPARRNGLSKGIQFSIVYGGDVNWVESQTDWVHMTDWRASNRSRLSPADAMDNKVERVTFLKHDDLPRLLTCRTLHFLMYNNRNRPYSFGTVLEVLGVGTSLDIPLATAHFALSHTVCKRELTTSTACTQVYSESVLLLRVGGEDYGLLFGKWNGFIPPRKGNENTEGSPGSPGQLDLRLWLLGSNATDQWVIIRRKGSLKEPGQYSFELPVPEENRFSTQSPVEFDFNSATLFTGHTKHVIPAYLISMAAAALHVTLQPRFAPQGWLYLRSTATMYPEWSVPQNPYDILRGAGGEVKEKYGNSGLWMMLLQILQSSKNTTKRGESLSFSGCIEDIRAPPGAVPGGCGGCGGGLSRGRGVLGTANGGLPSLAAAFGGFSC